MATRQKFKLIQGGAKPAKNTFEKEWRKKNPHLYLVNDPKSHPCYSK